MSDRRFPILGAFAPPMLGREAIFQRLVAALTKPSPDHLQVVGPRYAGKTVILNELARHLRSAGTPYTAVLLWDLGHETPNSDQFFMQSLATELSSALTAHHLDYANHLRDSHGYSYQEIAEVLDALKDDGGKVLAIMDGFDKPLSNGQLTRNLWDQLRALALKPSLTLVTASRRTLRELIRNPDSQTSDFWNIFEPSPVRVGCFDENDLTVVLRQLPDLKFAAGAQAELWNASNGFPVMVLEILNSLLDIGETSEINQELMLKACDHCFPSVRDKIDSLWTDCSPSSQDLFRRVLEERALIRTGIANADVDAVIERGFLHSTGNKLQRPNRLVEKYLEEQPNEGCALVRLFGASDVYQRHFRGVLERRMQQILNMDPTLRRFLERGVEDLPEHPHVFLSNVHGILEQGLSLVWKAECWDPDCIKPRIPPEWFSIWRFNGERGFEGWQARFPEGGQRLHLLDLMTGTQRIDRLARFVSKNTYVLANAVQGFRDFGVHPKTTEIDVSTAYAALHLCIEFAASITRELSKAFSSDKDTMMT
ncbi:ATP-binding protein [Geomonas sp. Red69]|uniref:ATP-binding protein n=1 Tax=Geomonas diazotrophica TaxID=2843197 RepID=UPI001C0FEF1D|nr:ATP-binding protein [Geomonas diazotrophica]MBU5637506.1 ATP-binding protein [Geomonas diazotrophica]